MLWNLSYGLFNWNELNNEWNSGFSFFNKQSQQAIPMLPQLGRIPDVTNANWYFCLDIYSKIYSYACYSVIHISVLVGIPGFKSWLGLSRLTLGIRDILCESLTMSPITIFRLVQSSRAQKYFGMKRMRRNFVKALRYVSYVKRCIKSNYWLFILMWLL